MKKSVNFIICLILPIFLFSQGNAGSFNLIKNAYVDISSVNFEIENQYTVMGWVKWNVDASSGESWFDVVQRNNNEKENYRQFWIQSNADNSRLEFTLQLDSNTKDMWSDSKIKEGEWFHFAATCNGNQQTLYINGVEESSQVSTGVSSSFASEFNLSLCSYASWNFAQNFDGEVDKVSVWKTILTQEEISSLMNVEKPPCSCHLVAYFSADEVEGNIFRDADENKDVDFYSDKH
ncbi:MAG: LamG domain-containing protein [Bacteroidales bacterium]|nr:LamG domain-containing protein [Bacteroidales bacterium]